MPYFGGRGRIGLAWSVAALLAIGLTALVMLPAAWLAPRLADATGGRIALRDVEGSMWNGSGQLLLGGSDDPVERGLIPGRLAWHLESASLLDLRLDLSLSEPQLLEHPVLVVLRRGSIEIEPGRLNFSLTLLKALGAPFNTLDLAGRGALAWGVWHIDRGRAMGRAALELVDLASPLSAVRPLGSYRADFDGEADVMQLAVITEHGPLIVSASGQLASSNISIAGTLEAERGSEQRLDDLLSVLGRKEDGVVSFAFETSY